jgi:hypothetical protein
MNYALRMQVPSLVTLLVASLTVHSAFAQETTTPPPRPGVASLQPGEPGPVPAAPTPDQSVPAGDGCRDKWLGMGHVCRNRTWAGPEIMLGADLGFSAMTESGPFGMNNGVGGATQAGPAWGVRAGIEVFPWLGLEGRYVGMYNGVQASMSPAGGAAFFTTGGEAVARFTLPMIPFVRPYVFGGVGYYDTSLAGSSVARAATPFHSSSEPGVPMGVGLDVPLTWYMSIDAEATYHFLIGESFSAVTTNGIDGGDYSTFNAVLRVRL